MTRAQLVPLLLLLIVALPLSGTDDANQARGFEAGKLYDFIGLDSVNVFNGNLIIAVPIGQTYSVSPSLQYQLTLTYNANVWDYYFFGGVRKAEPERFSNAGLGWNLSLGRLNLEQPAYVKYVTPDGREESFIWRSGDPAHIEHTNGEPYLRLTKVAPYLIETADGLRHSFDSTGRLTSIVDRFDNWVTVVYDSAGTWTIKDGHGNETARTHTVKLQVAPNALYPAANKNFATRIDKVSLAAFGAQTADYTFKYEEAAVIVGQACGQSEGQVAQNWHVPLLTSVTLPANAGSYTFTYRKQDGTMPCSTGSIAEMGLPTGGSIAWEYGIYPLPHPDCTMSTTANSSLWYDDYSGVTKRTLKTETGAILEQTAYDPKLRVEPRRRMMCDDGGKLTSIDGPGPPVLLTNTVSTLTGQTTKHHFSVFAAVGTVWAREDADVADYGLPLTRTVKDADHFLSTEISDGGGLRRQSYVQYDYEYGRPRLLSSRTVYVDDICVTPATKCFVQTTSSRFDGVGHYREKVTTSNFPGAVPHTTTRNYNPGRTASTLWPHTEPWILNTYTTATESDGTVMSSSETTFQAGKGVISSVETGTDANALLRVLCRDSRGFVERERFVFAGTDPRQDCAPSNQRTLLVAGEYELTHTNVFTSAALTGHTATYTDSNFNIVDETFDARTGRISTTRDPASLSTTYSYDALGRLLTVVVPGGPTTTYQYDAKGADTPARVTETTRGGLLTAQRRWTYDDVGRLHREFRSIPNNQWALREVTYDSGGRTASSSEWIAVASADDVVTHPSASERTATEYDIFGRPVSTTRPDGSRTTYTYISDRSTTRTTMVMTSAGSQQNNPVTETYDALGRLRSVTEHAGMRSDTDRLGAPSTTTYTYTPTGKLSSVTMGTQGRAFTYDHRDLLTHESHPEQSVTYANHNALGKFESRDDGNGAVTYVYDNAGRLTEVKSGGATLKSFAFGASGAAKGRLLKSMRTNRLAAAGTIDVIEEYTYSSTHGLPTARKTTVQKGTEVLNVFTHTVAYDALLSPQSTAYPTCAGCTVPADAVGTLTMERDQRLLTSVKEGATTYGTMGYAANGMVKTVVHGGGTSTLVDTYTPDGALPRPGAIQFSGVVACTAPSQPTITPETEQMCANSPSTASVSAQQGVTFTWTISGGTFTGSNTGLSVTFTAGPSGSVSLNVTAANACATTTASRVLTIAPRPTATVTAGAAANEVRVDLTGAGPWNLVWQDGVQQNGITTSPAQRSVSETGTYSVSAVSDSVCPSGTTTGQVTYVVPPSALQATTQSNGTVLVTWVTVAGAASYELERGTRLFDETTFATIGTTTAPSFTDGPPAGATPVAYIYRVRARIGAARSDASHPDFAVTGAPLFTTDPIIARETSARGLYIDELRAAIDALRVASGLLPTFNGAPPATGTILGTHVTALIDGLDQVRSLWGHSSFTYSAGVLMPAWGGSIRAAHIQELRETVK